jgi:hypothetical protein
MKRWMKKLASPVVLVAIFATFALAGNATPVPAIGLYYTFGSDPTAGSGACGAPQWQLLFRTDNETLYYHASASSCTDWIPFNGAGAGAVTSITASTGITLTPNPITSAGTVGITNTAVTAGTYTNATVTFNAQGQATAASNGISPSVITVTNENAGTIEICQAIYQTTTTSGVNLAEANASGTSQVIALISSTTIATTAQWDAVVTGESGGLTPGTTYWLDPTTAGNLTATPPSTVTQFDTYVGVAQSSTVMILGIAQPIGV